MRGAYWWACVPIRRSRAGRPTNGGVWRSALFLLDLALIALPGGVAVAQAPGGWTDQVFREPRYERRAHRRESVTRSMDVRDGGARPAIKPAPPVKVHFPYDFAPQSIVISVAERRLYFVLPDQEAYDYRIGVGREGFGWTGTEVVSRKQPWPDWYWPAEMRERDPSLPEKMTGGIKNPLGAMALYLGDTLYRIHGTNDAKSIGRAESSGCFRMLNSAVLHLASITPIGTPVAVVSALPSVQVSRAPKPQSPTSEPFQKSHTPAPLERATSLAPDYRTLRDQTLRAD